MLRSVEGMHSCHLGPCHSDRPTGLLASASAGDTDDSHALQLCRICLSACDHMLGDCSGIGRLHVIRCGGEDETKADSKDLVTIWLEAVQVVRQL